MTKRAIVYARVNTREQAEVGYGLPYQIAKCEEYAELRGYHIETATPATPMTLATPLAPVTPLTPATPLASRHPQHPTRNTQHLTPITHTCLWYSSASSCSKGGHAAERCRRRYVHPCGSVGWFAFRSANRIRCEWRRG